MLLLSSVLSLSLSGARDQVHRVRTSGPAQPDEQHGVEVLPGRRGRRAERLGGLYSSLPVSADAPVAAGGEGRGRARRAGSRNGGGGGGGWGARGSRDDFFVSRSDPGL